MGDFSKQWENVSYLNLLKQYSILQQHALPLEDIRKVRAGLTSSEKQVVRKYRELGEYLNVGNLRHVVYSLCQEEKTTAEKLGEKIGYTEEDIQNLLKSGLCTSELLDTICTYFGIQKIPEFSRYILEI